jgi:hypothetical protein
MPRGASNVKEGRVVPHLLVSRGNDEAGTWWQPEQVGDLGTALDEVRLMPRPKELVGVREISGPDIPATAPRTRRMAEPVYRPVPAPSDQ